jgi:hypothetical protein
MEPDPSLSVDDAFDAVVRDGAANDIGTLIYVLTFGITTAITVYAIYDTFRAMVDGQIDKTGFSIYVVRALAMLMMLHILLQFILAK